jgi:hypothetical protein
MSGREESSHARRVFVRMPRETGLSSFIQGKEYSREMTLPGFVHARWMAVLNPAEMGG